MPPEQQIQSTTKAPTVASSSGPETSWTNPTNVYADDGSNATVAFSSGGEQADPLLFHTFGFNIPTDAIIDGVVLTVDGSAFSITGDLHLTSDAGNSSNVDVGTLATTYGGSEDLWGLALTPAIVNDANFGGSIDIFDTSGGDGSASVDYIEITVYWHYDLTVDPAEVPIRHLYKVYSINGEYLGNIPKVISPFGFSQDMNAVGSQITIEVGLSADTSRLASDRIVTEAGDPIITEDSDYIYTEGQLPIIAQGSSDDTSILIRNGNRIVVYEYNYWYPNGKAMFSGQMNRIEAGFGEGAGETIKITVLSDGLDFDNYIARGAPFSYSNDQSQATGSSSVTITQDSKGAGWNRYGQSFVIGAAVTNIGQITLKLKGNATVTVSIYDGVTGNFLDSVTKAVNTAGVAATVQFALATLLTVDTGADYFFSVSVAAGQSIIIYYSASNPYNTGGMYNSNYAGGSGGGGWTAVASSDLYFVTASGLPTTTATYTSKDPSTEMLSPILLDYNVRGGRIVERNFDATALSLTATFNTNTILEAIRSCLSMAPSDFYYFVDLGTNEIDFLETSTVADYVLVKGRHLNSINLVMSIENVKNHLLFSGGPTAGVNLYKQYQDTESQNQYGVRLDRKSDNRVTVAATANAIGNSFIEEKADEENHTVVKVGYRSMDISLLTPGKVIGFSGFGSFIDNIIIQIVRREYTPEEVTLTLGILPPRFSPVIEKITRGLIAEQTLANPSAPS